MTTAMCPKQGLGSCQKYFQAQQKKTRLHSTFPRRNGYSRDKSQFVVDSGASMHMVSKKDLYSAELETMRTSRSPTTVMTANGEVQTKEEATVYVKQLDLFVKVLLLEETLAVLSLEKLCEDHGYTWQEFFFAIYPTMYHLWFPDYLRVLPHLHLHLPPHHLLHRSQHRRTEKTEKEVEVRMESFVEPAA